MVKTNSYKANSSDNPDRKRKNGNMRDRATINRIHMYREGKAKHDKDGMYRISKCGFTGDTRGNDWYADLVCIGIDDTMHLPLDQL